MSILSRLELSMKMALLLGLFEIALLAIAGAGASTLYQRMLDDRIEKLRAVVSSAITLAGSLEAQVEVHEITRQQAMDLFHAEVRAIRFDEGTGYLAALNVNSGVTVMHGTNPKLEGTSSALDVATGKPISGLLMDAIRSSDKGIATYMFPKPGQTEPLRKVVYLARFPAWNIAIFAGAYTDDLDVAFHASMLRLSAFAGVILLLTMLVAWMVNRDITGSLGRLKAAMERLAGGDLGPRSRSGSPG